MLTRQLRALALFAAAGCGDADPAPVHSGSNSAASPATSEGAFEAPASEGSALQLAADETFVLGPAPDFDSDYGNGNFGHWVTDAKGLPAYQYTNGSPADLQKFTADRPYHLLGNSGSLTHSYSNGHHALFSARTFPRYANYFRPERQAWSGGFGWVLDRTADPSAAPWSTYFPEVRDATRYETTWGMGYARKTVERGKIEVVEDTFSPPGDDEVIMQRITITNRSEESKELSYYSYWDWDPYILQGTALANAAHYENETNYQLYCDPQRQALKASSMEQGGNLAAGSADKDPSPRVAFFSLLNGDMTGHEMVKSNVFAPGVMEPKPSNLQVNGLTSSGAVCDNQPGATAYNSKDMLFVAEKRVALAPGESTTLYTLYGFTRKNFAQPDQPNVDADAIIDAYRSNYEGRFDQTVDYFERKSVRFTPPSNEDKWLSREVAWSNYHLHAGVLREDYFGVRTLNQNSQYLLDSGQNIAPRDNVQHVEPLIYSSPDIAKETLIYVLGGMYSAGNDLFKAGELPFGTSGYGAVSGAGAASAPFGLHPSDLGLWLGLGIAEYVQATRDFAFLSEQHPNRDSDRGNPSSWPDVYSALKNAINYQLDGVGTGEHDLVKVRSADWADFLTRANFPDLSYLPLWAASHEKGESTMSTALAVYVYPMVREIALHRGDSEFASKLEAAQSKLREGLLAAWKGKFFNRAWLATDASGTLAELGANTFWADSNVFTLLPEKLLDPAKLQSMLDMLSSTPGLITDLGLNITAPAAREGVWAPAPGDTTWYSLNGAFIRGLAGYAPESTAARELAWAELKRNTLAKHATVYPNMFYGLTSGSDSWVTTTNNDPAVSVPGTSWLETMLTPATGSTDIPHSINNMHSHSHLVYNTLKLAGVKPTAAGYEIRPAIAPGETIGWESETFGIRYEAAQITGKLRPASTGTVSMTVALGSALSMAPSLSVQAGGAALQFERVGDALTFQLPTTANQSTVWSIAAN